MPTPPVSWDPPVKPTQPCYSIAAVPILGKIAQGQQEQESDGWQWIRYECEGVNKYQSGNSSTNQIILRAGIQQNDHSRGYATNFVKLATDIVDRTARPNGLQQVSGYTAVEGARELIAGQGEAKAGEKEATRKAPKAKDREPAVAQAGEREIDDGGKPMRRE
ncbi:unnamed protein product [Symbiodinium sp. CCMP2592]|nr:unnamed protein product [Symbiodinium sp. CCMP2592]